MTYKDLLLQYINSSAAMTEYQFTKIKDKAQWVRSYFKARSFNMGVNSPEPYEMKFLDENPKYFNQLDKNTLILILDRSRNPKLIAKRIVELEGDNLNWNRMRYIIKKSTDPYYIVNLIGINRVYEIIKKANKDELYTLLSYSKNTDDIIKIIIDAKGDSLNSEFFNLLLKTTENPITIAQLIGIDKINEYLKKLDHNDIELILHNFKNVYDISKLIINAKGDNISRLDLNVIKHYVPEIFK